MSGRHSGPLVSVRMDTGTDAGGEALEAGPAGSGRSGRRWPHVALGLYAVTCLLALVWPVFDRVANRLEPYVLGLPFSLAWIVGWALLTFGVLVAYYAVTEGRD